MRATVRDTQTLELIDPNDLAKYLTAHAWVNVRPYGDLGTVYQQIKDGKRFELLIPLTRDIGDYPQRIADVIRTLETVEDRPQIQILTDITAANADVVRIRREEAVDGSIPLEDGASMVKSAYELALAAACAAVTPRLYYQGKRPAQATDYVRRARLGQSERGSYVLTVISPLPARIEQPGLFTIADPFERQVTRLISSSLDATVEASEFALRRASNEHFREATVSGVSANLLDAVIGLTGVRHSAVDVSFSWSAELPAPQDNLGHIITIEPEFVPVLQEASKFLKLQEPTPPVVVAGVIIGLRRPQGVARGRATMLSLLDGRPRHVNMELAGEYYDIAITAHRGHRPISCFGQLVRLGKVTILKDIRAFELVPEIDEDQEPTEPDLNFQTEE